MNHLTDVIIVGGGAAGLFCASLLSRKGLSVLLLEQNKVVGKKLALTGNGKCNYTNLFQSEACYRSTDIKKAYSIISSFNTEQIIDIFRRIGILPDIKKGRSSYHEEAGYVYPFSGSGKEFVQALAEDCLSKGVKIRTNTKVNSLKKEGDIFSVITGDNNYAYQSKNVVIATGGLALPSSGSDGSIKTVISNLGHKFLKEVPALTQLKTKSKEIAHLSGLRLQAKISIFIKESLIAEEIGELQFSDRGISGIPAMQVSGLVARLLQEGEEIFGEIDFFPFSDFNESLSYLMRRQNDLSEKPFSNFFLGMFPEKLTTLLLKPFEKTYHKISEISSEDRKNICSRIKNFSFSIDGTGDFSSSQTTSGGLLLSEVDDFLCSNYVKNLYFAGEFLDVDGLCGGYNLTWAWASAFRISEKIGENE